MQIVFTLHVESSIWGYAKTCIDIFINIIFILGRNCLFLILRKYILVQCLLYLFSWERWMLILRGVKGVFGWNTEVTLVSSCCYGRKIISSNPYVGEDRENVSSGPVSIKRAEYWSACSISCRVLLSCPGGSYMDGFWTAWNVGSLQTGDLFFYVKVVLDVFPKGIVTGLYTRSSGQTLFQRSQYPRYW